MRLLSFNGIEFTGMESAYRMSVDADINEMRAAGRNGAYDLLGDGFQIGNQSYAAEFLVVDDCDDPRNQLIDQLRGAIQTPGDLIGEFDTGRRRAKARLVSVKSEPNFNDIRAGINRVICEFRAAPFWHDDALTVSPLTSATTLYAVNSGNAVTTKLKITITSAIASTLTITNTTNGEALVYGATKANGAVMVIDGDAGTVTVDGANVYGNTSRADTQIALLSLAAGTNKLAFGAAVTGRVEYRGCWV